MPTARRRDDRGHRAGAGPVGGHAGRLCGGGAGAGHALPASSPEPATATTIEARAATAAARHEPCGEEESTAAGLSQQLDEAGGSLTSETRGRADSSPDNDGTGQHHQMAWVRQARREGVREKPATERLSSKYHQLEPDGSGL